MIKRLFDVASSLILLLILLPVLVLVALMVKLTSPGPVLYWSDRVGRLNTLFRMPKFRSMRVGAPVIATHLLSDPDVYLTPVGRLLRRTSVDELPQLWCIFKGDMSLVGPRPALFNQDDLIALRTECGVHNMLPGLTGWAQINGRDELPISEKVALDLEYSRRQSISIDIKIVALTLFKVFKRANISH